MSDLVWLYWRNKLTGEVVMTTSNAYSEYPDWEMAARSTYEVWMCIAPADEAPQRGVEDAGDGWESAGAYSHKAGAIQWENGYAAIKQLAESAAGHEKDSRFMHETLDAIHSIAAQELENAQAAKQAPSATGDQAAK